MDTKETREGPCRFTPRTDNRRRVVSSGSTHAEGRSPETILAWSPPYYGPGLINQKGCTV